MPDAPWKDCILDDLVETNPEALGGSTPPRSRFRYIDINSVTLGKIDWQSVSEVEFRSAPSRARRIVSPGDTLFCTVRPSLQAHAYADWNQQVGFICSTGFAVLRPKQADERFIFHTIFSEAVASHVRRREVGSSYPAVNETDLKQTPLCVPELEVEQSRIAEILDTLDAAIRETEAVVAKLRQVKAGLLHDLLTRGLDARGHLRDLARHPEQFQDSPLGVIPKGWQARECKELFSLRSGNTPSRGEFRRYYENGTIPWVKTLDLNEGWITDTDERLTTLALQVGSIALRPANTILIAMYGGWEQIGRTGILAIEAATNQAVCALVRKTEDIEPEFAFRAFQHRRFAWRRVAASSRKDPNITKEDIATFLLPVPKTADEQKAIAARIWDSEQRIDLETKKLSKLQSLKRGLGHDLLTGRVRVKLPPQP
jgi:type I restriction enzyme S subunit